MKRHGLTKSIRFKVFARDNFTCRYCGRQSDEVKLVIDHITPLCQGGTNSEDNLITACEPCNQGKAGKTIAQSAPSDMDRLRIHQEFQEQSALHKHAVEACRIRKKIQRDICNYFCQATCRSKMNTPLLLVLTAFAREFGPELVFEWIDIATRRLGVNQGDNTYGRYISGIRRHYLEDLNARKIS